jgi:hypothetical protein
MGKFLAKKLSYFFINLKSIVITNIEQIELFHTFIDRRGETVKRKRKNHEELAIIQQHSKAS